MVIRYIGIFHSALKGHPMKALLFSVLLLLPGLFASAADKPDFSDIEALPLLADGTCHNNTVPESHRCTLRCIDPQNHCSEAYLIMWDEDDQEVYVFRGYKDERPSTLLWERDPRI